MLKPYVVYYLHYKDDRFFVNNWNTCRDYACCVEAESIEQAIEKTKELALNQQGSSHIKILGFGHAKQEWVDNTSPLKSDDEYYNKAVEETFKKIAAQEITTFSHRQENKSYKYGS